MFKSLLKNEFLQFKKNKGLYSWLTLGILCLGAYLRIIGLSKGIWLDEAHTLNLIFSHNFLHHLRFTDHPPLYFILLKLWSQLNTSEEFLRLLSVIFGIGTIGLVLKWVKPYSHYGSLLAGLIVATLPMMLRYSQELRDYSLLIFAFTLSLYYSSQLIREPEKLFDYLALGISLCIAVTTHYPDWAYSITWHYTACRICRYSDCYDSQTKNKNCFNHRINIIVFYICNRLDEE